MRLGVIADAHANLPALRAALGLLRARGCDRVVHLGDAVCIGPRPRETVELLLEEGVTCLMGNHDHWANHGRDPGSSGDPEEMEHCRWTSSRLPEDLLARMSEWPAVATIDAVACTHYPGPVPSFRPIVHDPTGEQLEELFCDAPGTFLLYGHHHPRADTSHRGRRYVNPGSLGCCREPVARALVVETQTLGVEHVSVPYDAGSVAEDMDLFEVPARDMLKRLLLPVSH